MLDDVERGRLLVKPSREYALPLPVGALHVELDEGSGQPLALPRRSRFAGPQPHDSVSHMHRLSWLQHYVADDPIALVEQPENRDPLRHRRHIGLRRRPAGGRASLPPDGRLLRLAVAAITAGQKKQR